MRFRPLPGFSSGTQVALGESFVERPVNPRGDCGDCGEIGGCARALVRSRTCSDYFAGKIVGLWLDESWEIFAGLLVPYAAVFVLHLEHPFDIPSSLVKDIGS